MPAALDLANVTQKLALVVAPLVIAGAHALACGDAPAGELAPGQAAPVVGSSGAPGTPGSPGTPGGSPAGSSGGGTDGGLDAHGDGPGTPPVSPHVHRGPTPPSPCST